MSSAYRYGTWDGAFSGQTASEIAQSRTDEREAEIRRPGRKIDVMSEEEWQRRVAAAREKRAALEAQMREERRRRSRSDNEKARPILDRYLAEVNLQRQYQKQMPKKLRDYHEVPGGSTVTKDEWKAAHQDIGHFLTLALLAYHYQLDEEKGIAAGPNLYKYPDHTLQLDVPQGHNLRAYFQHRGLSATDDELKYFEGCISKKVSHQSPPIDPHGLSPNDIAWAL